MDTLSLRNELLQAERTPPAEPEKLIEEMGLRSAAIHARIGSMMGGSSIINEARMTAGGRTRLLDMRMVTDRLTDFESGRLDPLKAAELAVELQLLAAEFKGRMHHAMRSNAMHSVPEMFTDHSGMMEPVIAIHDHPGATDDGMIERLPEPSAEGSAPRGETALAA